MDDLVKELSIFIDRNLFTIRPILSSIVCITAAALVFQSKNGKRRTDLASMLRCRGSILFGRFIVDNQINFYHEPVLLRLVRGRRAMAQIPSKHLVPIHIQGVTLKCAEDWISIKAKIHGKFGLIKVLGANEGFINTKAYIRNRWFHVLRTEVKQ
jgi:hypothetical protein